MLAVVSEGAGMYRDRAGEWCESGLRELVDENRSANERDRKTEGEGESESETVMLMRHVDVVDVGAVAMRAQRASGGRVVSADDGQPPEIEMEMKIGMDQAGAVGVPRLGRIGDGGKPATGFGGPAGRYSLSDPAMGSGLGFYYYSCYICDRDRRCKIWVHPVSRLLVAKPLELAFPNPRGIRPRASSSSMELEIGGQFLWCGRLSLPRLRAIRSLPCSSVPWPKLV